MAPATVQRYETSLKHTQDFVWETYHKKDILLDEVSRQFVEDYEFWLKTSKKCCHNTATKYLKNFKKIIRIALAKGWMKNDPFWKSGSRWIRWSRTSWKIRKSED